MKSLLTALLVISVSCLTGCQNRYAEIDMLWANLYPLSEDFDEAISRTRMFVKSDENRSLFIQYAGRKARATELSFYDQLRLTGFIRILMECAKQSEVFTIRNIIKEGCRHKDFYGMVLACPDPIVMPFIIDTLKSTNDYICCVFNPDGSDGENGFIKSNHNITRGLIYELEKATGQNYGHDAKSWEKWWTRDGQYLKYDKEKSIFIHSNALASPCKPEGCNGPGDQVTQTPTGF